jgi:hypothetical protein
LSCNSGQKKNSYATTVQNKNSQNTAANTEKATGINVSSSFDLKSVIADADVKGLNVEMG